MQTRASKEARARMEQERADRHNRIARQMPPPTLHKGVIAEARYVWAKPQPKLTKAQKVRQDIRDSARGEDCTVRLIGVCRNDTETTVWSHYPLNDAGKGMGTKSLDLAGCYCCAACHDVVDGRVRPPGGVSRTFVMLAWFEGHMRSLVRLAEKGLLP